MATLTLMPTEHVPVLAPELIALSDPAAGETAIDCTFGGGGHSLRLAERLGPDGELICIDRDPEAEERFAEIRDELAAPARFVGAEFATALESLSEDGVTADLIVIDLGLSSDQLAGAERGFSYAYDAPLDMRMDTRQPLSAREVLNDWPEDRLASAIRDLGEERHARAIAREVVRRRPLATTGELAEAVRDAVPASYRFGRGHPAKRTFQAIRIAVNGELDSLDRALPLAWELLRVGGRLAVISFHSLEDRRVKRFLAERYRGCVCPPELPVCVCGAEAEAEPLTRGALRPSDTEAERNPRSRSARMRIARKLASGRSV